MSKSAQHMTTKPTQSEITDEWVDTWFVGKCDSDQLFLEQLRVEYRTFRAGGSQPRAAFGSTVRQYPIFADIKV